MGTLGDPPPLNLYFQIDQQTTKITLLVQRGGIHYLLENEKNILLKFRVPQSISQLFSQSPVTSQSPKYPLLLYIC